MADCEVFVREVRFVLGDEATHVYVLMEGRGDCPFFVDGWHHKKFDAGMSIEDIVAGLSDGDDEDNPMAWARMAPPAEEPRGSRWEAYEFIRDRQEDMLGGAQSIEQIEAIHVALGAGDVPDTRGSVSASYAAMVLADMMAKGEIEEPPVRSS